MRVGIYLRVSTDDQTVENQRRELEKVALMRGWNVVAYFEDEGISGSKGRGERPGFNALWNAVENKEIDLVAAWAVDRIGRSMLDLINFMCDLRKHGADLYLHQQQVDTSTPAGRLMLHMFMAFAEFEREMIGDRVKSGMARAKASGKHVGAPRMDAVKRQQIIDGLTAQKPAKDIAALVGCSVSMVGKVKTEMRVN